ncbi:hypothetical protein H4219_003115 [Mycoemilia scoparia]|uniref:Uncharacterized protein n=1 Tax=Mycoemilia scoparia TaxID=417184 RepID=A0A9W8DTG8_9FUNG|nr:hypothetical protein H4219_003115 [Mycoemilia scoparia]
MSNLPPELNCSNLEEIEKHLKKVNTISIYESNTGEGLRSPQQFIKAYPNLKGIRITRDYMKYSNRTNLVRLNQQVISLSLLKGCRSESFSITDYGSLRNLRILKIHQFRIPLRIFDILDHIPTLEELQISTLAPLEFNRADTDNDSGQLKTYPNINCLKIKFKNPDTQSQLLTLKDIKNKFPNLKSLGYLATLNTQEPRMGLQPPPPPPPQREVVSVLNLPFIGLTTPQFQKLTHLSIHDLTEYSAKSIGQHVPNLEHLTVHECSFSKNNWMVKGYQYILTENMYPNLKTLIFDFDHRGNGQGVELFKTQPFENPSESLSATNSITCNLPNLEHLGFGRLEFTLDVLFVLDQLPRLQRLSIRLEFFYGIEALNDTHHIITSLCVLEIRFDQLIKDIHKIGRLFEIFPNLRAVRIFDPTTAYKATIRELKKQYPNTTFLMNNQAPLFALGGS